jgi:hypothetical protein
MRIRSHIAAVLLVFAAAVAGCATTGLYGAASFRVDSNVPDATVWVDDTLVGTVAQWSKPGRFIRPGFHRVEVRAPGYYSHFAEVDLKEGGGATVKADQHPQLP